MPNMLAETYVLQAIQNGITSIQQNTAQLADILDALNANELAAAQRYFGAATTKITVAPGFPMEPTQLPFIGVTVANADQNMGQTPIGMMADMVVNSDGTYTVVQGARFNGSIKCTIYTPNADLIVWLSEIALWSLLSQYALFTNAGMGRLQTSIGDYEPSPGFLPIFTFARGVFLSAQYTKTFSSVPVQTLTSATVTFTDTTS